MSARILLLLLLGESLGAHAVKRGITLTRFTNTALAGAGDAQVVTSLKNIATSETKAPSSLLLSGQVAPPAAGNYGFNVTFDPPLPFPSPEAYCRLWVHDHLLYPTNTAGGEGYKPQAGSGAPLWLPLPPRALDLDGTTVEHIGAAPLRSYELRLEYVCLKAAGCGKQTLSLEWNNWSASDVKTVYARAAAAAAASTTAAAGLNGPAPPSPPAPPPYSPIPASALSPAQSEPEVTRRALYKKLQSGWGTYFHPSVLTWVLLPESFAVNVGLYRLSTGTFLGNLCDPAGATPCPVESLTINPTAMHQYAIRAGLHSYDNSYIEASITWRQGGGNLNVSIATTVDTADSSFLTMTATVNNPSGTINVSDFMLMLSPTFEHGRAGTVHADNKSISGVSAGLRTSMLSLVQGRSGKLTNSSQVGGAYLAVGLSTSVPVVLSTDSTLSAATIAKKTVAYRSKEAATLDKYGEWADVKDAMQSSLMWSFMYDPKEGLVAPVTRNWAFAKQSIDGDQSEGLFCWDGSFASYMLSLDSLDWSFSNLIQIIKMRTSAGFIPSYSAGTKKTRDRSNPPVTAKILHEITKRWGANKTQWVVELCFDDLLNWNTWMWTRRTETPLGLLTWGSDPHPYAPDQSGSDLRGCGSGCASLESGLDNGPVMEGVPFNQTGRYLQDEYDAGYTGMYLMDCLAQIELAKMVGRTDAVATLQTRFDKVNAAMLKVLWNETAGYFQNKLSADLSPVERMAPTHFYPMLVGPNKGPSEKQVTTTIQKHMTNPARFAVWPSGAEPRDHPPPPDGARPLVQWQLKRCGNGTAAAADVDANAANVDSVDSAASSGGAPLQPSTCPHILCCQLRCNFNVRANTKMRYEGMALGPNDLDDVDFGNVVDDAAAQGVHPHDGNSSSGSNTTPPKVVPLFDYVCGKGPNASDFAYGPAGWKPQHGAPCKLVNASHPPSMYVYAAPAGPSAADLVPLEVWYRPTPSDHYFVGTAAGKADAAASGYAKVGILGYIWPAPGQPTATSRYGLPSISKDDPEYIDQNYWHGRTWSPMIQLVYWGLEQYTSPEAKGAAAGLVAQSKNLLLKEWYGYGGENSYAGSGRYVYENFGADTGEGYGYSSEAQPMYSWGALAGFIGLQANGFYEPLEMLTDTEATKTK